ncbi:hypothetical protein CG724_36855 [Streptomyces sp. CB02120-2]|nr:hypothetical protein CG724_36855 [Streptomyces sp. CB02120-2]
MLLVRRRVAEGRLSWQFPAGKVEAGERGQAAAVWETKEETGLDVTAVTLLGERVHPITGRLMSYAACAVTRVRTPTFEDHGRAGALGADGDLRHSGALLISSRRLPRPGWEHT